jgi:hypothetical protein
MIASLPGTVIADARMFWILDRNTFFDPYRTMPAGGLNENVQDLGGGQWSGEVVADTSKTATGVAIADRYFFTLPDTDFLYPGDELRIYFQATDDASNVTTLPADVSGFATGSPWSINFTIHGLPSIKDAAGTQPSKLVLNDSGFTFAINSAMAQLGFVPGTDFDTYWTMGQSSGLSNSIGSGGYHGAIADQLANYDTIVYLGGSTSGANLSDGNGLVRDYANDIALINDWHALAGERKIVYFGDYLASGPGAPSTGYDSSFTLNTMGLTVVDVDVRDEIDNQTAPLVRPLDVNFSTEFAAFGGCLGINEFDSIRAAASSTRGHGFVDPVTDTVYADIAASVIYDRLEPPITGDRKVDMTFPYSLIYVYDTNGKTEGSTSARSELLREIFGFFGVPSSGTGTVIGAPAAKAISMAVYPNPFNPQTTVKFANLPEKAVGSVKVYNLRGELVATLHSGEFSKPSFVWNGTDSSGASVASGVYMIEGQAAGFREVVKVALVK